MDGSDIRYMLLKEVMPEFGNPRKRQFQVKSSRRVVLRQRTTTRGNRAPLRSIH